jgi:PRTRC genetic system protein E
MLKQIAQILKPGDTVTLVLTAGEADQLHLNVIPRLTPRKGKDDDDDDDDDEAKQRMALNQPLTLSGTAAELDSPEAFAALTQYTDGLTGLRTTLAEAEAEVKKADEAAKAETAKKKSGKPAPKPAPKPVIKGPTKPAAVKTPPRPAPGGGKVATKAPETKTAAIAEGTADAAAAGAAPVAGTPPAAEAPAPEPAPEPAPKPAEPANALSKTTSLL